MEQKIIFAFIPLVVLITVFSLTTQDVFAETREECRSLTMNDRSLTPVERIYALKTCDPGESDSSFQKYYSEELHNECPRQLKVNSHLNHMSRLNDLNECNKLQKIDPSSKSQKLTKFSRTTIEFCDEKYQVYLLVGAKKMYNHAGGKTEQCIQLFSAPMYNSTASDRNIQLQKYILDQVQQSVEENKELRLEGIEEAQLRDPVFSHLKYLFDEQIEKIENIEKQLQEKNIMSDYSKQSFFNEKYEDCIKIIYDETIVDDKKIIALNNCSKDESITFDEEEIIEHSKNLIQRCDNAYDEFLYLTLEDYYASINYPQASECVMLYTDPIWRYDGDDRNEVIQKFIIEKTLNDNYEYIDRKKSVEDANLSAGLVPILPDLYKYQKQKIQMLEDLFSLHK